MDQRHEISFSLPKPHLLSKVNVGFHGQDVKGNPARIGIGNGARNGSSSFDTPPLFAIPEKENEQQHSFVVPALPSLSQGLDKESVVEDVDSVVYISEGVEIVEETDGGPDVKVRHPSDPLISTHPRQRRKRQSDSAVVPLSAKLPKVQSPASIAFTYDNEPLDKFGLFVSPKLPEHVLSSADDSVSEYVLSCARTYTSLWEFRPSLSVVDLRIPNDLAKKISSNEKFHITLLQQAFNALSGVLKVGTLLLPTLAARNVSPLKELLSALNKPPVPRISSLVLHLSTIPVLSSSQELEIEQLLKSSRISQLEIVCSEVRQGKVFAKKLEQLAQSDVQVSYKVTERRPFFALEEENEVDDGNIIPNPKELLHSLNWNDSVQPSTIPPLLPIPPKPHPKASFRADCTYTPKSELSEDDSYASTMWHLERLHESGCDGEGTTIAVIDSGVHYIHPAFKGRISHVRNFVPNELDNFDCVIDSDGHGSQCAGIAAGSSFSCPRDCSDEDSTTILVPPGVAPKAKLVICKVVGTKSGVAESAVITAALQWLKELHQSGTKIDVVSISLASSCFSSIETAIISELTTMGMIIVCCASNEGRMRFQPISFPGRLGNVLCIGAHNYNGKPTSFSPVGRELDFLAPGSEVGGPGPGTSGPFAMDFASGTSFATPAVAGLVSLVLHRFKKMGKEHPKKFQLYGRPVADHVSNCWIMRELIKEMSSSPGHHSEEIGHGTIDPYRILDRSDDELYRLVESLVED